MSVRTPAFVHIVPARIEGVVSRKMVVMLKTRGCSHLLSEAEGCNFCGLSAFSTQGQPVSGMDILEQFEKAFSSREFRREGISGLDILNAGSFLSPREIPAPVRLEIFNIFLQSPALKKVFFESRPDFIATEKDSLKNLSALVKDITLEAGIGLETMDDRIRNEVLNKRFTRAQFEQSLQVLSSFKIGAAVYVMVKPQGFSEAGAIKDAIDTLFYLGDLKKKLNMPLRAILYPAYVPVDTPLEDLFNEGSYSPPWLWSVIEVIRATLTLPLEIELILNDYGLSRGRMPCNCEECTDQAYEALENFSLTGDRKGMASLKCACRLKWKDLLRET